VISYWIDRPAASGDTLHFSGMIPGGYSGPKGMLLTLVFKAKQEGTGAISVSNVNAFLNDGQGTAVSSTGMTLPFTVTQNPQPAADLAQARLLDTDPPEPFAVDVSRDPNLLDGKLAAMFAAQDKGSGIDRYFVLESIRPVDASGTDPALWKLAESPYALQDQSGRSIVYVKAVDRSGNQRIGYWAPRAEPVPFYLTRWFYGILLIIVVLAVFFFPEGKRKKAESEKS